MLTHSLTQERMGSEGSVQDAGGIRGSAERRADSPRFAPVPLEDFLLPEIAVEGHDVGSFPADHLGCPCRDGQAAEGPVSPSTLACGGLRILGLSLCYSPFFLSRWGLSGEPRAHWYSLA